MVASLRLEQARRGSVPLQSVLDRAQTSSPRAAASRPVLSSRWAALAVAAVVLALPVGNMEMPGLGVDVALPAVAAGSGLAALLEIAARRRLAVRSTVLLASGSTVVAGALSAFASTDTATPLSGFLVSVVGYFLAIMAASVCQDRVNVRVLVVVMLTVGAGMCLGALGAASSLQIAFGGGVVNGRATGVFGQPNELGCFAAVIGVLGVGTMLTNRRWMAVLGALAAICAVPALLLSFSRGAWIGTVTGVGLLLVLVPCARRRILPKLVAAAALVTGVGLLGLLPASLSDGPVGAVADRVMSVFDATNNPYDERPAIWAEAFQQIRNSPVLGTGPGTFKSVATEASYGSPAIDADHAHNFALTVAAETGLLGLATLIVAIVAGMIAVALTVHRWGWERARVPMVFGAGLSVVLAQGTVDYPLPNPVLATTTWLLIGLLAGTTASQRHHLRTSSSASAARAGLGARS